VSDAQRAAHQRPPPSRVDVPIADTRFLREEEVWLGSQQSIGPKRGAQDVLAEASIRVDLVDVVRDSAEDGPGSDEVVGTPVRDNGRMPD
jgi:hypothetical protein